MERIFELVNSTGWKFGGFREEDKGKLQITEICRAISKQCGGVWKVWYYGKQYGAYGRSQRFCDKKGDSVVNVLPKKHILYDNLDELELTPAERSCARIMDGLADPAEIIYAVRYHEGLERLIKAGLKRLAREIMDLNAESWLKRVECLRKDQLKRLAQYDGGAHAWVLLKQFPNITDRNLKEFCRIRSEFKARDILSFKEDYNLNLNHLFTLWRNTGGIRQNVITEYKDYLEMAGQRGSNIHDEIIYRNKRWKEFHDRYVEERNAELARQKAEREKAKADRWKCINRDYKRNIKIFGWEKDGYCIIVPKSADEINEEGQKQHHCVGAQEQYKNKMAARQSYIVFLTMQNYDKGIKYKQMGIPLPISMTWDKFFNEIRTVFFDFEENYKERLKEIYPETVQKEPKSVPKTEKTDIKPQKTAEIVKEPQKTAEEQPKEEAAPAAEETTVPAAEEVQPATEKSQPAAEADEIRQAYHKTFRLIREIEKNMGEREWGKAYTGADVLAVTIDWISVQIQEQVNEALDAEFDNE